MKDFGFVTEIDGVAVYRSLTDPKVEVEVVKGKAKKLKKKIRELAKDDRRKGLGK